MSMPVIMSFQSERDAASLMWNFNCAVNAKACSFGASSLKRTTGTKSELGIMSRGAEGE